MIGTDENIILWDKIHFDPRPMKLDINYGLYRLGDKTWTIEFLQDNCRQVDIYDIPPLDRILLYLFKTHDIPIYLLRRD